MEENRGMTTLELQYLAWLLLAGLCSGSFWRSPCSSFDKLNRRMGRAFRTSPSCAAHSYTSFRNCSAGATIPNANSVSQELLNLIKMNISGWNRAELMADTGIGRTIESLLGINMNSSKAPDYKGIELKSKRKKAQRSTLLSQVPDWNLSKLNNAREIVDKYGYFDGPNHKTLQITVEAQKVTRQNLSLNVDYANDYLEMLEMAKDEEQLKKVDDVTVWLLPQLHSRLLEKHKETFWIDVENKTNNGNEYFRISSIEHTKNPLVSQFDLLLEQGRIQLDLMLSRASGNGDTFAFKIRKSDRKFLFPESELYIINS